MSAYKILSLKQEFFLLYRFLRQVLFTKISVIFVHNLFCDFSCLSFSLSGFFWKAQRVAIYLLYTWDFVQVYMSYSEHTSMLFFPSKHWEPKVGTWSQ